MSKGTVSRRSLAEQLMELSNPAPKDADPENIGAGLGLEPLQMDRVDDVDAGATSSTGRIEERRPMRAEPAMGPKYRGRPTSRSALKDSLESDSEMEVQVRGDSFGDSSSEESDMASEDDERQRAADMLQAQLEQQLGSGSESADMDEDEQSEGSEEESEQEDTTEAVRGLKISSQSSDAEKATATKVQRNMWDTFLDMRIQLQPLLEAASRLPAPPLVSLVEEANLPDISSALEESKESLKSLLNDLMFAQESLFGNHDEVDRATRCKKRKHDEMTGESENQSTDQMWTEHEELNAAFAPWSNTALDEWSAKALYASGINVAKLKTINQSIPKQVDDIMNSNRAKLMKRAHTRRAELPQLCSPEEQTHDEVIDNELFDDGDFYQMLLKELVESGLQDTTDPVELTRQYLKIRNAAGKKKHRAGVDRRASKGRKLKYTEHAKLLSFMAPEPMRHPMQTAPVADQLSLSLFGKRVLYASE